MRLHHSPASPFVRKVDVLLHETGRTGDVERVPAAGHALDPSGMPTAVNPLGKIPCLERPDGPALFDSRVITRYLDATFGSGLYPAPPRLWETLTLEAMADGMAEAAVLMRYESVLRPEGQRSEAWVEGQWAKVARSLDVLESRWGAFLAGPLDMGQIALACALGYLDFRHGARHWREGRPALAAWAVRMAARPSMQATEPPA